MRPEVEEGGHLEGHGNAVGRRRGLPPLDQEGSPMDDTMCLDSGYTLKTHKIERQPPKIRIRTPPKIHMATLIIYLSQLLGWLSSVISNNNHPPKTHWH